MFIKTLKAQLHILEVICQIPQLALLREDVNANILQMAVDLCRHDAFKYCNDLNVCFILAFLCMDLKNMDLCNLSLLHKCEVWTFGMNLCNLF